MNRNRDRFGGGAGYARDPMCGMQVEVAHAPASTSRDGRRIYFCSEHCRHRYLEQPPAEGGRTSSPVIRN